MIDFTSIPGSLGCRTDGGLAMVGGVVRLLCSVTVLGP